jgi:hypothetical protein
VGAGLAGAAAAWAARRAGAPVVVVYDRAGSSAVGSGALDLVPRDGPVDEAAEAGLIADPHVVDFFRELHGYELGVRRIATREGVVRRALGADQALIDLEPLRGKRVLVADVERDEWDASLVAEQLSASSFAEETGTSFVPVRIKALRGGHERRIAPYDFAALHDDPERRQAFAELLNAADPAAEAFLLGPWLGIEIGTAAAFRKLCRVPAGETTSAMGGAAGARFERSRDALFLTHHIGSTQARLSSVQPRGGRWVLELGGGAEGGHPKEIEAVAVVLATGGVAAGGVTLAWEPGEGARGFVLPFEAPAMLSLDGELIAAGGSMFGPTLERLGLSALERVGIATSEDGEVFGPDGVTRGLYAAGDAVAKHPRTALRAVLDGIRAGTRAASSH